MGSAFTAPGASAAPAAPAAGAAWHHNLQTIELEALEALYAWHESTVELLEGPGIHLHAIADAASVETRGLLVRGMRAAMVTIYRELLTRGGRAMFAGGNVGPVRVGELRGARLGAVCESPVCHLEHDGDGRHRKAAHT